MLKRWIFPGVLFLCHFASAAPRAEKLGNIPLHFEPIPGGEGRFVARLPHGSMYVTAEGATMVLRGGEVVRMKLPAAKQSQGLEQLPGVSNYFLGNDPKQWRTGVPHFARVETKEVYAGIDVVYYGNGLIWSMTSMSLLAPIPTRFSLILKARNQWS